MRYGDYHDRLLCDAVRRRRALNDGLCQVYVDKPGRHLRVTVYGEEIFRHDSETGYWRICDGGHRKPWIVGKMNACLSGVNANVRVYIEERSGALMATSANATLGRGNYFTWRTYNV